MKLSVPWSVKGIRPEARETAREAARRSGMSLGEWLNTVILHQAAEDGSEYDDDEVDSRELAAVNQKLDDLSRRIEQFSRSNRGPEAYAPKAKERDDSSQIAELINRLDRRLDQFVSQAQTVVAPPLQPAMHPQTMPQPGYQQILPNVPPVRMPPALDMAVAEIAARQRALNGQPPLGQPPLGQPSLNQSPLGRAPLGQPPLGQQPFAAPPQRQQAMPAVVQPAPQPVLMPVPQQDLSGLEDQLRTITNQIETLRKPGVEEAINALRAELGDIARSLTDAMPRQAIDAIEQQIQGLTHRIAEGKQAGVDAGALNGVEHGLAEVRDALRGLTPAENLVGFNEAVAGLAHKIDLIVADKDPETLHQLEHAITTLRDMASHVASTEAVTGLALHVEQLADRVEHLAASNNGSDALNHLENRISALADALSQRSESGANVPPMLESLVQSLSDKIELLQQNRGDNIVSSHLEDQIVALVQRLDASDSRLGHLEAVERGLADLLVHMEELRANKNGGGIRAEPSPVVDELKNDMARTQDALHQVNGTLGTLVDRLAKLENGIRSGSAPTPAAAPPITPPPMPAEYQAPPRKRPVSVEEFDEARQPFGKVAARVVVDQQPAAAAAPQQRYEPAPQPAQRQAAPQPPAPEPSPKRLPQAHNLPINPDLPPDEPLEPGSGPPKFRANPGARIAASEAALGGSCPHAASAGGKSGFIAAARRAANAAVQKTAERAPPAAPPPPEPDILDLEEPDSPSLRSKMMKRVKSLFIGASIAAVVVGSVQIAGTFFEFGKPEGAKVARNSDDDITTASTAKPATKSAARPDAQVRVITNPLATAKPSNAVPLDYGITSPSMPSLLNPPAMNPTSMNPTSMNPPVAAPRAVTPSAAIADVTGSIPTPNLTRPQTTAPAAPPADRLPVAIGGNKLRNAAAAGDPAAAYEIAVRFAEGRGVPVSLEEAARWYERAASKGLAPAQFRYASLLEKGQGVKKDLVQARRLYLAAAGKGNGKAMHNLAVLYAEGVEGKPDYVNAAQWFRKAAQRGIADSQYNLGVLCARGLGTEKNPAESYQWFALAAAQGDKESAKKRDEIAAHMDEDTLAGAQRAVQNFTVEPQPSDATLVPEPAGGWDGVTSAPAPRPRQVGPLSLGSLQTR